jgi:hypothetical protein
VKKISSGFTFFNKKIFPLLWFGFLGVFIITGFTESLKDRRGVDADMLPFLIIPVAMVVFGFFMMRVLVWDLVDEVYDCGDSLIVRNNGQEESVALSNVMNVSASVMTNPPRITLRLVQPGAFGQKIAFSPARGMFSNPFRQDPIAEDLIVRVDKARSARASR